MNKKTFYHIADIIQENRSWIKVIGTDKFIEMNIIQGGVLKPLLFQAITLQNFRERPGFQRTRTWNINEYDIGKAVASLCQKDPSASERVESNKLTLHDVEYIIEKASFGIIKLDLYEFDY